MTSYWLAMKNLLAVLLVLALGLTFFFLRPSEVDGAHPVEPSSAEQVGHVSESTVLIGDLEEIPSTRRESVDVATGGDEKEMDAASESGLWLRGRVLGAGQEKISVEGAEVRFDLSDSLGVVFHGEARSGSDGRFAIRLVGLPELPASAKPNFDAVLRARAVGYQPAWLRVDERAVFLGKAAVEVVVRAGPVLFGRVVASSGEPVADAYVSAETLGGDVQQPPTGGVTDEQGEFVLARYPGEAIALNVEARGLERERIVFGASSVPDDGDLGVIQLESGWPLAGHLLCPHGEPLAGVDLYVAAVREPGESSHGSRRAIDVVTDAAGGFSVSGLTVGPHTVTVGGERLGVFEAGETDLRLVTSQALVIARVVDEEGNALPGLDLSIDVGEIVEGEFESGELLRSWTDAPGGDAYLLYPRTKGDHLVVSCSTEDGRWAEESVERAPGACVNEVELVLPSEMPMGTLRLDVTGEDVRLVLWPLDHSAGFMAFQGVGPHIVPAGRYEGRLRGEGRYELPIDLGSLFVRAGSETVITRRLGLGGRIALEVEVDRKPPGAELTREAGSHQKWSLRASARLQGEGRSWSSELFWDESSTRRSSRIGLGERRLLNSVLRPGVYQIEVSAEGYRPFTTSVVVIAGKTSEVAALLRSKE